MSATDDARVAIGSWLNAHSVLMLAAGFCVAATRRGEWVALAGSASFAAFLYRSRSSFAALQPYGGYANRLTALRLLLILAAAATLGRLPTGTLLAICGLNVVLDVADGWVARRNRAVTAVGTVFDRETDALFVLVAYAYFFVAAHVAAWILLPGLLPYAYRLLTPTRLDLAAPDRKEHIAKVLAGVNFAVLLVALALPTQSAYVLLLSASIVASSFLLSFWNLHRDAHSVP